MAILEMLRGKIHRATVTDANLNYEGSVSIDPKLYKAAGLKLNQKVDIVNVNNGQRLSTYIINGKDGEICLNGAAARKAEIGDKVIIIGYHTMEETEADGYSPLLVMVDENNKRINS